MLNDVVIADKLASYPGSYHLIYVGDCPVTCARVRPKEGFLQQWSHRGLSGLCQCGPIMYDDPRQEVQQDFTFSQPPTQQISFDGLGSTPP